MNNLIAFFTTIFTIASLVCTLPVVRFNSIFRRAITINPPIYTTFKTNSFNSVNSAVRNFASFSNQATLARSTFTPRTNNIYVTNFGALTTQNHTSFTFGSTISNSPQLKSQTLTLPDTEEEYFWVYHSSYMLASDEFSAFLPFYSPFAYNFVSDAPMDVLVLDATAENYYPDCDVCFGLTDCELFCYPESDSTVVFTGISTIDPINFYLYVLMSRSAIEYYSTQAETNDTTVNRESVQRTETEIKSGLTATEPTATNSKSSSMVLAPNMFFLVFGFLVHLNLIFNKL